MIVVTLLGGVIADRLNRKMVLIAGDVMSFLMLLLLAMLLLFDVAKLWHVFLLSFLHGAAFSTVMPARAALIQDVVGKGDLTKGVALYTMTFSVGQLAGPALAGYLMDLRPEQLGWAFLAAAVLMIPAIPLLMYLRLPRRGAPADGSARAPVLKSIAEGLAHVKASRLLIGLLLMSVVFSVFGFSYTTLLPVFARDILDVGPDGLGLLLAAGGAGAIAGSMVVALFTSARQMQNLMIVGGLGIGPMLFLFALSDHFYVSIAMAFLLGTVLQIFGVGAFALVQVVSPAHMRGRTISIFMLAWGLGPVGMVLLGIAAEVLKPDVAVMAMGVIYMVIQTCIILAIPALRRMAAAIGEQTPVPIGESPSPEPAVSAEDD